MGEQLHRRRFGCESLSGLAACSRRIELNDYDYDVPKTPADGICKTLHFTTMPQEGLTGSAAETRHNTPTSRGESDLWRQHSH